MSDSQTLDLTNVAEPVVSEVVDDVENVENVENVDDVENVENVDDVPDNEVPVEEAAEEPVVSEEAAEEPVVLEEAAEEPVVLEEAAEEPVVLEVVEEPVVSSPEPSAPVEQVVSDIRDILADVPAPTLNEEATLESSDSYELTDDLKQRIAELDYLRELCGKWSNGEIVKKQFLPLWDNKSITTNSDVNYEDTLVQLEKMPELIKLWNSKAINFKTNNYFKNIETYNLEKSLFSEDQSEEQKVEVLEQLVTLLTDCANGKMKVNQIEEVIDNLY